MDFNKFVYEKKIHLTNIAKECNLSRSTITKLKKRSHSPNLLTALKLRALSNNELELDMMLTDEDIRDYLSFLAKIKKKRS